MANEFVIESGLISRGNSSFSGSLTATSLTGSHLGTSSLAITASRAITSSFITASGIGGALTIDQGGTNCRSGTTAGSTIQDTGVLYRSGNQVVTMNNPGNLYLTFDGTTLAASAATIGNTTSVNNLAVHNNATFDIGLNVPAGQYISIGSTTFLTNGIDFQYGPGGATNASPYMYTTYINNGSGPHIVSNYNAQGNFDSLYEERFFSGDSSYTTALGYVRYDDAGGALNIVFGSDGGGDKVTINTSTGKITANGGVDPPYVLYDAHTRQETKERVLSEVPTAKQTGGAQFWNSETKRMEVYVASEDKFYTVTGEEIPN